MDIRINLLSPLYCTGKWYNVAVNTEQTVYEVKTMYSNRKSFPLEEMQLIYQSKLLAETKTLEECGIKDGYSIYVVRIPQVRFVAHVGDQEFEGTVCSYSNISFQMLCNSIYNTCEIPNERNFKIIWDGSEITPENVDSINWKGDVVHLEIILFSSAKSATK